MGILLQIQTSKQYRGTFTSLDLFLLVRGIGLVLNLTYCDHLMKVNTGFPKLRQPLQDILTDGLAVQQAQIGFCSLPGRYMIWHNFSYSKTALAFLDYSE